MSILDIDILRTLIIEKTCNRGTDADYYYRCDIEQEFNGLYSYDRKEKVPASRVKSIMDAAHKYYYEHVAPK
jgi:hypothetical protein